MARSAVTASSSPISARMLKKLLKRLVADALLHRMTLRGELLADAASRRAPIHAQHRILRLALGRPQTAIGLYQASLARNVQRNRAECLLLFGLVRRPRRFLLFAAPRRSFW